MIPHPTVQQQEYKTNLSNRFGYKYTILSQLDGVAEVWFPYLVNGGCRAILNDQEIANDEFLFASQFSDLEIKNAKKTKLINFF